MKTNLTSQTPEELKELRKKKNKPYIILTAFCIAITFFAIMIGSSSDSDGNKTSEPSEPKKEQFGKQMAYIQSQLFIQEKIVSPSSAKFPYDYNEVVTMIDDTTYIVKSYVDSENRFGAMMRSDYSCKVIYHPATDMVTCKDLVLEQR